MPHENQARRAKLNMKLCFKRDRWVKRAGILLVALALITGITGCQAVPQQYTLIISNSAGGNVVTPGEGTFTVDESTVIQLVAEPDSNFHFVRWSGDVDTVTDVWDASTTITIQGDYTIAAEFGVDPEELVEYDLTASSTAGGSVTVPGEGTFSYEPHTVVDLVAVANDDYYFVDWTGDVGAIADPGDASTTITMNDDYSVVANFDRIEYDLTIFSTDGGSVTDPGEGVYTYGAGTLVALAAVADDYYEFVGWTGDVGDVDDPLFSTTTVNVNDNYSITANFAFKVEPTIAAGAAHTVGLRSDGTVMAAGSNASGQCGVSDWEHIVQLAAGEAHTIGVRNDGTVVAAGSNTSGQCDVGNWTDIVQVAAGATHTVGLRADGTVVAVGNNDYGQCNVGSWTDIVQVAAGGFHTLGLKEDGTVVAIGLNNYGQCNVGSWTDIIQVEGGALHSVGLKDDGTAVAKGWNLLAQCNVGAWHSVSQVASGGYHSLGLRDDGTVVAVGLNNYGQCDVGSWADIVQVAADEAHTVGLRDDGTAVATGDNAYGQCDVDGWNLN
jgi:uncharacterized repeat protein (TIGR02543 family)